ncbi:prolipoprotein diacylglyceryl transferase [Hymenobacter sp. RP-2-7]|uniref:Prolipoprotein diacylglyceryl transferase n=1 Tax=Hymenobacter polaris TaxID=2682546 RepID=A0A7Y0AD65_9BACT|nr:prolipoprotein diacylglyceryl transferase family protein [Hymenobacter polaris]NML65198.1 prolipoprotein diacylglyceryl transferase [Hymenobacter polaris]
MPLPLLLPSPLGHPYYEAAQVVAFAVYVALLLGQGYRRGYAQRAWLPLVAATTLGLVLGCQLVLLPLGQWPGWLRGDAAAVQALAGGPRSIIGGAWGSFLVVLALGPLLGLRVRAVLDALAAPLCWALAVQSVGCVLAGCCWGTATTGAWGVAYRPGSAAYVIQVALGQLPAGAAHTHVLVPTQLLQLLLCAGAGLALHLLRRRAWPAGSRYLLGLGLLCLGRFAVEFWRDPAGEPLLAAPVVVGGVTLVGMQWLMLAETLLLLGGWAWLVRQRRPAPAALPAPRPITTALLALGLLAATTRLAPTTLSLAETAVLQLLLLLVLLAEGHTWLVTLGRGVPRLAGLPLAVLLGGALLLATAQAPAPAQEPIAQQGQTLTLTGGLIGSDHDAFNKFSNGSGCGGGTTYNLHQQVRAGGIEIARQRERQNGRSGYVTVGGGLWAGQQRIDLQPVFTTTPSLSTESYALVDAHGYLEASVGRGWSTLGFRIGAHLGDLGHYSYFVNDNSTQAAFFMPEGMLRVGNPQLLFAQADAGYGAENALGAYTTRLALGSGLGQAGGGQLLLGYANSAHYPTPSLAFASANLRLPAGLRAVSLEPYFATDFDRHNIFSMKLHYQLGSR